MCPLGSWTEVNSRARYFGRTNQIRRRCKQTLFSGKKSYVVMWRWRKELALVEIERRRLRRPKAPFVSKTIDRFGRFERALSENRPPCLIAYMLVQWRAYKEAYLISRDYSRLVTSLSLLDVLFRKFWCTSHARYKNSRDSRYPIFRISSEALSDLFQVYDYSNFLYQQNITDYVGLNSGPLRCAES